MSEIKDAWPLSEIRQKLMLENAHSLLKSKPRYRGVPLWSMVSDLTGHGSRYSIEVCKRCGWSPDREARLPLSGFEPTPPERID